LSLDRFSYDRYKRHNFSLLAVLIRLEQKTSLLLNHALFMISIA
jgi:hypothetical protein